MERFADALNGVRVGRISISGCKPPIEGTRGIRTTTKLQYCNEKWQLLGREHEYSFPLRDREPLEVSAQLYLNNTGHWRLFAFVRGGMLFSVNLTRMRERADFVVLKQKLVICTRDMTSEQRALAVDALAHQLARLGLEVSEDGRVILGTFDGRRGAFLDTTPAAFVRDFVATAVLKGHFMANKGYALPKLVRVGTSERASTETVTLHRAVPLGLRFRVLERDSGRCVLCGATAADGIHLHVDHVVPWSHGGRTEIDNLQTMCAPCNLGKGNRSTRRYARTAKAG